MRRRKQHTALHFCTKYIILKDGRVFCQMCIRDRDMVKKGITARQIINERSIRNALTCDMALGCSTNTVLHLLSLIHI